MSLFAIGSAIVGGIGNYLGQTNSANTQAESARRASVAQSEAANAAIGKQTESDEWTQTLLNSLDRNQNSQLALDYQKANQAINTGSTDASRNLSLGQKALQDDIGNAISLSTGVYGSKEDQALLNLYKAQQQIQNTIQGAKGQNDLTVNKASDVLSSQTGISNQNISEGIERARQSLVDATGQANAALNPYTQAGNQAVDNYLKAITPGSGYQIDETPAFKFQKEQLIKDISQQLAARGTVRSEADLKTFVTPALMNLYSQESNNQINRLLPIIQTGAQGASNIAGVNQSFGQQLATLYGAGGAQKAQVGSTAAAQIAQTNLTGTGLNSSLANSQATLAGQSGALASQIPIQTGNSIANILYGGNVLSGQSANEGATAMANLDLSKQQNLLNLYGSELSNKLNINSSIIGNKVSQENMSTANMQNLLTNKGNSIAQGYLNVGNAESAGIKGATQALTGTVNDIVGIESRQAELQRQDQARKELLNLYKSSAI